MGYKEIEKLVFSDSFKKAFMCAYVCAIQEGTNAVKRNSDPKSIYDWGKTAGILTAFYEMLGMIKENGHD